MSSANGSKTESNEGYGGTTAGREAGRPRVWTPFLVFVLAVVAQGFAALVVHFLVGDAIEKELQWRDVSLRILVVEGVFAALAIGAALVSPVSTTARLGIRRGAVWPLVILGLFGALALDRSLEALIQSAGQPSA